MIIRKFKVFLWGQDDQEIQWLNAMSQTGLNLMNKYGFLYVFEKNNMHYIYAKDFLPRSMPDDLRSYCLKQYQKHNIKLILKRGNSYYLARDVKDGTYMIHDVQEHQIVYLKYIRNHLMALITLMMIFFEMTFDKISYINEQIIYICAYLVLTFWIAINYVSVSKRLKEKDNHYLKN